MRMLREELLLLQEPGSYVGEVVKVMGKSKVLVKVIARLKYPAEELMFLFSCQLCQCSSTTLHVYFIYLELRVSFIYSFSIVVVNG